MKKVQEEYQCSLQLATDILGGKWKLRILWYLRKGPLRYSDLMRPLPDISQKALTQQLRDLEASDIVSRRVYAEVPPRVEYSLTPHGRRLEQSLQYLRDWAHYYADEKHIRLNLNDPEEPGTGKTTG